MIEEQPKIPYLKLCQIISASDEGASYIEDADANIKKANNIQYPLQLSVEVIEWEEQAEFDRRGKINAFHSELVEIVEPVQNIRQEVFNQLVGQYPNLVI